ncbi:DUF3710 domain-containing protein [Micrococcales bacterium 31B]|nr:DUF3710 domain-containing protein [Micrococcales bacterium 31B]
MGWFGRKKTSHSAELEESLSASPDTVDESDEANAPDDAEVDDSALDDDANETEGDSDETPDPAAIPAGGGRRRAATVERGTKPTEPEGPWDEREKPSDVEYIDLGSLLVPAIDGLEVNIEVDQNTNQPTAVNLIKDGSGLQVQAFAAPRTDGVWDEIRGELTKAIKDQGGVALPMQGRFGWELQAGIPVRLDDGRVGQRPVRFVGVDGPRWFVRGVISGKAASAGTTDSSMDDLFAKVVVVRGPLAMAPRDLLELKLPQESQDSQDKSAAAAQSKEPDLGPLERGPEITQIG